MEVRAADTTGRPLRRGESASVEIDELTHDGRGVARVGGKVVFVPDALPGERVELTLMRRRRRYDEARLDAVIEASPRRVQPVCAWFGTCGGCALQHLEADAQLAAKQQTLLQMLARIGKVEPGQVLEPVRGPLTGYRRRARLGVKFVDGKGRVLVGFRERHKPFITDMAGCEVLDPGAARLIAPLQALVGELSIRRRLPQIEVAVGNEGVTLVLRVLDPPDAGDLQRLRDFAAAEQVRIALQPAGPDSVRGLDGELPMLSYDLPRFDLRLGFLATDFVQVNEAINRAMIAAVVDRLDPAPADRVLDLYCGIGNFTLPLARRAGEVVGVEGSVELIERARANAASNRVGNASFVVADLAVDPGQLPCLAGRYDLVVLDPPRSGAADVCVQLARIGARRVAYVSCHPATLARDASTLVHEAGYRLAAAGVLDMFPQTAHVESLALFEREAGR